MRVLLSIIFILISFPVLANCECAGNVYLRVSYQDIAGKKQDVQVFGSGWPVATVRRRENEEVFLERLTAGARFELVSDYNTRAIRTRAHGEVYIPFVVKTGKLLTMAQIAKVEEVNVLGSGCGAWPSSVKANNSTIVSTTEPVKVEVLPGKRPGGLRYRVFFRNNDGNLIWLNYKPDYPNYCKPDRPATAINVSTGKKIAIVLADILNIRARPSASAVMINRAPVGSRVNVLDQNGPAITMNGEQGKWNKVILEDCAQHLGMKDCKYGVAGWVPSQFLGSVEKFKPVTRWRHGLVGGYGGDYAFSYLTRPDGSFQLGDTCGNYNDPSWCRAEGWLYRYRNVVLARWYRETAVFVVDNAGRLCFPPPAQAYAGDIVYEVIGDRSGRCDQ